MNVNKNEVISIIIGGLLTGLISIGMGLVSQSDMNNQIDEKIAEKLEAQNKEET